MLKTLSFAALCAAITPSQSLADAISVSPVLNANGLETSFDLTLDVSETRYLAVAYGGTDAGDDCAAWSVTNILGEVGTSTTSYSCAAPEGWGKSVRAMRFFLLEKETRPYDSRVEWIESTGAEWINTGYIGKYTDIYDIHFAWYSGTFPMASFSDASASKNKRYSVLDMGNGFGCAVNSQYSNSSACDTLTYSRRPAVAGEEVYARTTIAQGIQTVAVSTKSFDDAGITATIKATAAVANTTAPLYLFSRNNNDTSTDITHGGTTDSPCAMRLWSCYATHNGTAVLDFIPCVKDGEAMLYEKVNNRLHRNVSGAGAFTAGPVVEEILAGATAAASVAIAPSRPVALVEIVSATSSAVQFSATLALSGSAVSATFAYGDSPDALGDAAEVSADWAQGGEVSFSATGLSAGGRKYGVLALSQGGVVVRTYGFWFVAAGAEGRAVAVGAENDGGVIEAVLSRSAGETNYVFVAYGATQGGDTPESWENCDKVCVAGPETTSVEATVPGWGTTAVAARFFLKEYVAHPYDSEVEYIASSGTQWINTGYLSRTNDIYSLSFRSEQRTKHFIVGAYGSAGMDPVSNDKTQGTRVTVMQVTPNTTGYIQQFGRGYNGYYSSGVATLPMRLGVDHELVTEFLYGSQVLKIGYEGGALVYAGGWTYNLDFNCDSPVYVFARNCGNTTTDIAATVGSSKVDNIAAAARVYSLSITHNGELARDFVPVKKDGVGGLYDRVLKRCHWNVSGTGSFACGPEVEGTAGEPGETAAMSSVLLMREVSGSAVLKGAYATTADFSATLGSAGIAATANVVLEYGTTAEYGSSATVDAAMEPGATKSFSIGGLSANTAYFWRVTANNEEIASGTFTTQGAYRTVALREVVESADGETLCCKLDFGAAVQNETCRLVLAYGASEGDVALDSWENCVVVGSVAPGETSLEYRLPAGLVEGAFKYRFYLVADGDTPPGVQQVEYIESTGSEWIDTGWIGSFDDVYDISFRNLKAPSQWFMLGAYAPTINNRYTVVQSGGSNTFTFYFNDHGNSKGVVAQQNVDYRVVASIAYGAQSVRVSADGGDFETVGELSVEETPANTTAPLYLFCRNCANTSVDNVAMARLYSCTITHNGTVVRDFVPCVKGSEAGVYDRASGRFHGNISGSGAFVAGDAVGSAPAVYSYTVPTNGVGATADHASKADVTPAVSAVGHSVSATASVAALGLGDTYPRFEWWAEGGSVTNTIAFAAIPEGDTAETHEYSTTFDAGEAWNQTVYCRFAVSNVYTSAAGGTCVWQDFSGVRSVSVVDDCTYTWQAVDGDWNGDWTNAAHWASDRPGNCMGVPSATSSVFFPTGSISRVTMPDGLVEVYKLDISAPGLSVEFFNASNAATLQPAGLAIATNVKGAALNQNIAFDGVSVVKSNPSTMFYVCNASTFALRGGATINSTNLDMVNESNTGYNGRLDVGEGSLWPASGEIATFRIGDEGVVRIEGTFNVKKFMIGQYSNYGGGTLEIGGANPAVNVSTLFRCQNSTGYTKPSYITFDIPAEGWETAPLKGGASAGLLGGTATESANVSAKLVIAVPEDAPYIAARRGRPQPVKVPLISWPTGITVDRCELAPGNPKRVRFAWTYGGTDSEEDDGNPPTGLVAYVTGSAGTMVIVK